MSKPSFMKIKLPNLSIEKRDLRKNMSIRSLNLIPDKTISPRKTRLDLGSRGTLSTTPVNRKPLYDYRAMFKLDSQFKDTELFANQEKQKQQRVQTREVAVRRSVPQSEPQLPATASPMKRASQIKAQRQKLIQEKVQCLYIRVQEMLSKHKGYVRQAEKKDLQIKLVQLKKEFQLVNQDFNDFYQSDQGAILQDQLKSHMEILKGIFEQGRVIKTKNPRKTMFENEICQSDYTPLITEEASENQEIQLNLQTEPTESERQNQEEVTEDASPSKQQRSSQHRLSKVSRPSKMNIFTPEHIQETAVITPSNRNGRSQVKNDNNSSTPSNPRRNRFQVPQFEIPIQQISTRQTSQSLINNEQQLQPQSIQLEQASLHKRESFKRPSKVISRGLTKELSQLDSQRQLNYQYSQIHEESEIEMTTERQRLAETTTKRDDYLLDAQSEIERLLDVDGSPKHADESSPIQIDTIQHDVILQKTDQPLVVKQMTIIRPQTYKENLLIEMLAKSVNIYDLTQLDPFRKTKSKNTWNDDLNAILKIQYQFC